jgi:ELWxxDGT repeat protein
MWVSFGVHKTSMKTIIKLVFIVAIIFTTVKSNAQPQLVKDINTLPANSSSDPSSFVAINGKVCFIATNGKSGKELWVTDGTEPGTMMLKDINPGANSALSGKLAMFNGELFFVTMSYEDGVDLWKTDGTPAGTVKVKEMGNAYFNTKEFVEMNGELFFCSKCQLLRFRIVENGWHCSRNSYG